MNALIWIKNITILLFSVFFMIIGVNALFGSYSVKNPFEFIMYFFSACLLILVCAVGILYFFFRLLPQKQVGADHNEKQ